MNVRLRCLAQDTLSFNSFCLLLMTMNAEITKQEDRYRAWHKPSGLRELFSSVTGVSFLVLGKVVGVHSCLSYIKSCKIQYL